MAHKSIRLEMHFAPLGLYNIPDGAKIQNERYEISIRILFGFSRKDTNCVYPLKHYTNDYQ